MEKKEKIAICYDFDGTLSPGNMQEYGFIQALHMTPEEFWRKSNELVKFQSMDYNLAYMRTMLLEGRKNNIPITKDVLKQFGKKITYFKGVEGWFERINSYAKNKGIELHHYLISSGLRGIINGLSIAKEFDEIYASSFVYGDDGNAIWPAQTVNYTNKTQYLFRISKGYFDERDIRVNDKTPAESRNMTFDHMCYVGDGLTDIPCMTILRKLGGHSIAVYSAESGSEAAEKLKKDGRVDCIAVADYSENSEIDRCIKHWINNICQ